MWGGRGQGRGGRESLRSNPCVEGDAHTTEGGFGFHGDLPRTPRTMAGVGGENKLGSHNLHTHTHTQSECRSVFTHSPRPSEAWRHGTGRENLAGQNWRMPPDSHTHTHITHITRHAMTYVCTLINILYYIFYSIIYSMIIFNINIL